MRSNSAVAGSSRSRSGTVAPAGQAAITAVRA
jgi:hypothetical protein